MVEIVITSYFEDATGPRTGLSPTLRIWEVTASGEQLIVGAPCGTGQNTDGAMIELDDCGSPPSTMDGFYRFTFADTIGYNTTSSYVARVDGGVILATEFRYQTTNITPSDAVDSQFIADAVWNASASAYPAGGSPETMGGIQNNIEVIRLNDIPAVFALLDLVRKYNTNRTMIDPTTNTLTVYDDDCVTVLRVFRLLDSTSTPSTAEVCERTSIGGVPDGSSPSGFTGPDGQPTCS